jgi:beta-1,4-N-acetylglucosaminyltransferase
VSVERHRGVDVLLVCSSGGHLSQLLLLREAWAGYSHLWVTEATSDADSLLADEPSIRAFGPAHRNLKNGIRTIALAWLRNFALAWRVIGRERPALLLTTGAAVAVPFAWIGRLRGVRVVYVESVTRITSPSVSLRLIAPVAHHVYAQWPELLESVPRARYAGSVLAAG